MDNTPSIDELHDKMIRHQLTKKHESMFCGTSTLFRLQTHHPLRRACINIVKTKHFDYFVLCIILINSVFLALDNPIEAMSDAKETTFIIAEFFFTIVYVLEACIKIIAYGFVFNGNESYLRDHWNQLDFFVVSVALLSFLPFISAKELAAIRLVRLLRPLRTINTSENVKLLVTSLLKAIPQMSDVLMLLTIVFWTFALIGLQFFNGAFRQHCYNKTTNALVINDARCSGGSSAFTCDETTEQCLPNGENPNSGMIGFDNIGQALLTIFVATTQEGWVDTMYYVFETVSYWGVLYFISLMVLGSFFVTELVTAVIVNCYQKTKEQQEALLAALLEEQMSTRQLPSIVKPSQVAPTSIPSLAVPESIGGLKLTNGAHTLSQLRLNARLERQESVRGYLSTRLENSSKITKFCLHLSTHRHAEYTIIGLILINTVFMASEHAFQPQYWTTTLECLNYIFTSIFVCEMMIKIIGLGWWGYLQDNFNRFDGIIVIANVTEIIVHLSSGTSSAGLAALRTFRLLRSFKIARHWKNLHHLLATILGALPSVANFTILISLFVFIYAVLGMQLFAGRLIVDTVPARANFDTFSWSLVTVFQILSGENWNEVMQTGLAGTSGWSTVYFLSLYIFGNMIMLNLFLAILLSHFDKDEMKALETNTVLDFGDEDSVTVVDNNEHVILHQPPPPPPQSIPKVQSIRAYHVEPGEAVIVDNTTSLPGQTQHVSSSRISNDDDNDDDDDEERLRSQLQQVKIDDDNKEEEKTKEIEMVSTIDDDDDNDNNNNEKPRHQNTILDLRPPVRLQNDDDHENQSNNSCFCIPPQNRIRLAIIRLTHHSAFNSFILGVIIISTMLLATDDPTRDANAPKTTWEKTVEIMDIILTVIFTLEAILRIYALGFILHEGSYFRSGWNRMDFFIVVISLIDLFISGDSVSFLRAFRATRALRPLRLVRRVPNLRVIVESLLQAIPYIFNVLLVSLMFFLTFGVLGIQLFAGRFYQCEDSSGNVIYINQTQCEQTANVEWKNSDLGNFDNIFNSILMLFEMSTLEMWPNVMYRGVDAPRNIGEAPKRDAHQAISLYFIAFIIVSNFVLLNLVLGAVVDTFNEMKEKITGFGALTARQKMWVEIRKLFLFTRSRRRPTPPSQSWRKPSYDLIERTEFEMVIVGLIILNMIVLSMQYYGQSDDYSTMLFAFNVCFSIIFLLEAVVKLIALDMQYFQSSWNRFDFILVLASIVSFATTVSGTNLAFDPKILRIFRIPRILRLVEQLDGIRRLVNTLYYALESLLNIGSLMLLMFFMYAVMGMSLFGGMKYESFINDHNNFDNVGFAMLTLFRCSTGESWNGIMHEIQRNGSNTAKLLAAPYFVSFCIIGSFLLLNLFVAVIMEGFDDVGAEDSEAAAKHSALTGEDLQEFSRKWDSLAEHRPCYQFWAKSRSEWLNAKKLKQLFMSVRAPLGLQGRNYSPSQCLIWMESLNIPVYERKLTRTVGELLEDPNTSYLMKNHENLDDLIDVQEFYVHYFEVLTTVAHMAFKMKTNPKIRQQVRTQLRAARGYDINTIKQSKQFDPTITQRILMNDDDIDDIPSTCDAVASIQDRLAHRYRHLAHIARKAAEYGANDPQLPTSIPPSETMPDVRQMIVYPPSVATTKGETTARYRWRLIRENLKIITKHRRRHTTSTATTTNTSTSTTQQHQPKLRELMKTVTQLKPTDIYDEVNPSKRTITDITRSSLF